MRYTYDLSHCRRRGSNSQMLRKVCSMSELCSNLLADELDKPDSEPKQAVFMHDRQSADFSFENQLQKLLQTGLGTIQAGADVRDDLVAALLAEMFGLPDEIGLLIMTGYTRIADVETLLRFSTRPRFMRGSETFTP